jgi:ketosteroid isomerase-like protein
MLALLEELRAAAIVQDAERLAGLYAPEGVHEFPFVVPGAPTRIEGRAAIAEFNANAFRGGRFAYSEYRTIGTHQAGDTVLVVEQEAIGTNTLTGAVFALPNVWVIEVDNQGLIVSLRDYVNPVAVREALGEVSGAFNPVA